MLDVKALEAKAARLAALVKERDEAFRAERVAEAVVVDGVLRSVAPALSALCGRIEETRSDGPAGPVTGFLEKPGLKDIYFRGVLIHEDPNFKTVESGTLFRRIYLLSEPEKATEPWDTESWWLVQEFVLSDSYTGHAWTVEYEMIGTFEVLRRLGRRMKAEQVIEKIEGLIDAQLAGDIAKRTKEAQERAARMKLLADQMRPASATKKGGK